MRIINTFIVAETSHEFGESGKFNEGFVEAKKPTYTLRKVYELENFKYVIKRGSELTSITRKEFKELEANYVDFLTINARHS